AISSFWTILERLLLAMGYLAMKVLQQIKYPEKMTIGTQGETVKTLRATTASSTSSRMDSRILWMPKTARLVVTTTKHGSRRTFCICSMAITATRTCGTWLRVLA